MKQLMQSSTFAKGLLIAFLSIFALATTACGSSNQASNDKLKVAVTTQSWASLTKEIVGDKADLVEIVSSGGDPHDFEPTAKQVKQLVSANVVILNGLELDHWAEKALEASPSEKRTELDIAKLVNASSDDNPHLWYSVAAVDKAIVEISKIMSKQSPDNSDYFSSSAQMLKNEKLEPYFKLTNELRDQYPETKIAAIEGVAIALAVSLGFEVITPLSLIHSLSEHEPVNSAELNLALEQLRNKEPKLLIASDHRSDDSNVLVDAAKKSDIPVVTFSENPPEGKSFSQWQISQLQQLQTTLKS